MSSFIAASPEWWREAVVYQVYPASFKDTNGDGWGDIKGITSKLDYLKDLGVDIVWSSPFCKSPQKDMGYDISDYCDIDPIYGTLADVDELIAELKKLGMKLMVDLVVNHTSYKHAWFEESRASKMGAKRDWYIWKPANYDSSGMRQPPNNWSMILGEAESAWTWDEGTQEYYLSLFTPWQPDLNWENPAVRTAVHDVLRFWLDRGACGFRMDVINLISKVPGYPDGEVVAPDHEFQPGFKYFANGPRLHEYLQEINREVLSKYETITVGEMPFVKDEDEILKIVHPDRKELNMIFRFDHVGIDDIPNSYRMTLHDWKPSDLRKIMSHFQDLLNVGGWNSVFVENHDNPRSVSRYTSDAPADREICAKLLALMMTTLAGTLFVYQGQEIGMYNFPMDSNPDEYIEDVESINYWQKMQKMYSNDSKMLEHGKRVISMKARDHARSPIQWTGEAPNAGFCNGSVKPWMKMHPDFKAVNAESQINADDSDRLSVFQFWKRGLVNRKEHKNAFVYGSFEALGNVDDAENPVFAYRRGGKAESWVVVLNFSSKEVNWSIPNAVEVNQWVAGNYVKGKPEKVTSGQIVLRPWEGVLGQCK